MLLVIAVMVGSEVCRTCHPEIAASYARTPMARSSGPAASLDLPDATFTAAGHRYHLEGNHFTIQGSGVEFTAIADYFIGSGAHGRSFLVSRDRYLFELPVTWYAGKGIWDASPGYENNADVRLNRAVEPSCLFCHASRVRPIFGTQNRYAEPPFAEAGISCERCHGPGSEHARDPVAAPLLNPATAEPAVRDSVCAQCHLTGDARIERPGRTLAEFRAGDDLSAFATWFVLPGKGFKVTSHVEKLAENRCATPAGAKLACGTCHDPHPVSGQTQAESTLRMTVAACTGCHSEAHAAQPERAGRCPDCHMPKTKAVDGGHGVITDHSISIPSAQRETARTARDLRLFLGRSDDRALGLALAELGDRRAAEYLKRARPADTPVLLRLAALETDPSQAIALYQSVLRQDPHNPTALVNLGGLYAASGRLSDAAALWRHALEVNPGIEQAALNLARISPPDEASRILNHYLEIDPDSRAARALLTDQKR
jgi:Flp pilus assembly protein TadD